MADINEEAKLIEDFAETNLEPQELAEPIDNDEKLPVKWEYKLLPIGGKINVKVPLRLVSETLLSNGEDGWELVETVNFGLADRPDLYFIFKRQVKEIVVDEERGEELETEEEIE